MNSQSKTGGAVATNAFIYGGKGRKGRGRTMKMRGQSMGQSMGMGKSMGQSMGKSQSKSMGMGKSMGKSQMKARGRSSGIGGYWGAVLEQAIVPLTLLGIQQTYGRKRHLKGRTFKRRH